MDKYWEIECTTDVEVRWFGVEAPDEQRAIEILYENEPDVEDILDIWEVKE